MPILSAVRRVFGVVLASNTLAHGGAGVALSMGPICCGLLMSGRQDEAR
ncbi:MAG: hypothetical protein ABR573_06165 [Candidatus Dormibacteria bacterium]